MADSHFKAPFSPNSNLSRAQRSVNRTKTRSNRVVLSRISAQEGLSYTTYLGTTTQTADAAAVTALEAQAPAFRNTAYLKVGGKLGQVNRLPIVSSVFYGITPQRPFTGADVLATVTTFLYSDFNVATLSHLRRLIKWADGTYWMGTFVDTSGVPTQLLKSADAGASWTLVGGAIANWLGAANFSTNVTIFDSKGQSHVLTLLFAPAGLLLYFVLRLALRRRLAVGSAYAPR